MVGPTEISPVTTGRPQDGSASFTEYLARHDVPCPSCGYNLRGLEKPVCPECGLAAGWGAFGVWGLRSRPALYRAVEVCIYLSVMLGLFLLAFRFGRAVERHDLRQIAAAGLIPFASFIALWAWLAGRAALARAPAYLQARWASAAVALLALAVLFATGTGLL
jgi:hypothetical protein